MNAGDAPKLMPSLVPEYAHPLVKLALLPITLPLALILVPAFYIERRFR